MKIQEIVDGILAFHPDLGDMKTCDVLIGGDPNVTCTGIIVTIVPTVEIIRQAIANKANFILVHEPTYYSGYDPDTEWLEGNVVFEEKKKLLEDNGIVIFRDHDHMHAHQPDTIFHYMTKQLGWEEYLIDKENPVSGYRLPEQSFESVLNHIKDAMDLKTIRYIGNMDSKVSTVGIVGHLLPSNETNWGNNKEVAYSWNFDVVIPGEVVEWTLPLYIRDAVMLGKAKGMILPGHFVQEEAGMRWAVEWLEPIVKGAVSITYLSSGEIYSYK